MADDNGGGNINAFLGAVVGVLIIAVVALSFVVLNVGAGRQTADVSVDAPQMQSPG